MDLIERAFEERFAHWKLKLPRANVRTRQRGEIRKAGWVVQFLFGRDERGEYLDYYASHRMADDSHERLYADGSQVSLPVIISGFWGSDDPVEHAKLKAAYFEENARIAAELAEKGFGLTLNAGLRAGRADA
jgi:hypothetical protein